VQNPAAYRSDLAQTLNNLALLYRALHNNSAARSVGVEEIDRKP
jgi:hypothetical protein